MCSVYATNSTLLRYVGYICTLLLRIENSKNEKISNYSPKDHLNPNEVKQMFAHKLVRFYYIQPTPKVPNIVTIKKSYQTMYEVNETVSLRQKLNVKMPSNCSI